MRERVRYSVAELEALKESPLVEKPDGFEGIPAEWLEPTARWKTPSERKEVPARRQRNHHKSDGNQRNYPHESSRHHKRDAVEDADSEALPEWDDVSEPWVHSAAGNIEEFEHWKQKQRRAALQEAGFDDVHEDTVKASSSVQEEATKAAPEAEDAPKAEEKPERTIDIWDAQNVSFKKTGGASRFSFMGQQRQMPPATAPAKPDTGNDDFFNSLLEKRSTPDSSAPPGLTQTNRPRQQQGMNQPSINGQGYQGQGFPVAPTGYQVPPGYPMHFQAPPGFQGPPGMQAYPGVQAPPGMQAPPGLQQNSQVTGTPTKPPGLQQTPQKTPTSSNSPNSSGMQGTHLGMQPPPGLQKTPQNQATPSKTPGNPGAPPGLTQVPQLPGTPSKTPGIPHGHMQMPPGLNPSPMHQNAMSQGMMNMSPGQYPPGMTAPPGLHPQMMGYPYRYDPRMGQYNGSQANSYNRPPGL
ncbi:hypothetical protein B9G98_03905 [Wickerhamiella sorbophila]|uniref:Uncharacterized protein n=1 Tax=Wickerhamiella sorbophila TaxID=45607 RepID=A0A2T0FMT8_9ASCO|nr:hypothetical protein B9G98_03905 [Wickerhamiella sorbophila]PRT56285.1 hypothetical protein B9G98_03905 [Wickerhamiella sorbophila]